MTGYDVAPGPAYWFVYGAPAVRGVSELSVARR